jgi:uncharacterized protein involved in exopolysaccharide biosynthesis
MSAPPLNASPIEPLFRAAAPHLSHGFTGRDLLRQWFKYWGVICGSLVIVTAITLVGVGAQPASYVGTARVWVKTDQQGSTTFLSGVAAYREGQMTDPANRKLETEIQLLMARANVEAVVRRLKIRPDQLPQSALSYLLPRTTKAAASERQLQGTVDLFLKSLKIEAARSKTADTSSNLLEVSLEATDAALVPQALNALVEQYQRFGSDITRLQGQATHALISQKMAQAQAELYAIDGKIVKLTSAQALNIDAPGIPATVSERGLYGSDIASGEALRMDMMLGSTPGAPNTSVNLLKSQVVSQESKLDELRQLYTDDAEVIRSARRQLADTEARLKRRVKVGAEMEAQLKQLERSRSLAQDRFVELRRKLDQIELYLNSPADETATRVFTERARQPDQADKKKKMALLVLGPLAGLALGLLLAGLREYFDHRLQSGQDVQRYLGLETLGVIPEQLGVQA